MPSQYALLVQLAVAIAWEIRRRYVGRYSCKTIHSSSLSPAYHTLLINHLFSHMLLFRLNSFIRATGPLLVQENPDFSVVLELPVLLGDVTGVIAFGDCAEVLYSPSTYTASLVHVFLFLRWT
jgi:hypothetical protein